MNFTLSVMGILSPLANVRIIVIIQTVQFEVLDPMQVVHRARSLNLPHMAAKMRIHSPLNLRGASSREAVVELPRTRRLWDDVS